jgi:hypothetical protein
LDEEKLTDACLAQENGFSLAFLLRLLMKLVKKLCKNCGTC